MKPLYIYILITMSIILTGCSSDNDMFMDAVSQKGDMQDSITGISEGNTPGVYASIPELIDGNAINEGRGVAEATRSALSYSRSTRKMMFSWGSNDAEANMGVFAVDPQNTSVVPINFERQAGQDTTQLTGMFGTEAQIAALTNATTETQYIAFRPYTYSRQEIDYTKLPISYDGQTNGNNVKMGRYYVNNDSYVTYDASEKVASRHLGAYDFLVTEPQSTNEERSIYFALKRVGVVARFFIKCPAAETFEQLQLVTQGDSLFVLNGTLDLTSMKITTEGREDSITPKKQSNVMVLKYGDGLDMTDDTNTDYYYKNIGYMVSYMMLAPIDLSKNTSVNLYLVSHDAANVRKYYKSGDLKKPKLTSNMFYQWTSANNVADNTPITFQEVTVQEWEEGTSISNGEGTGTEGWAKRNKKDE